jgi:hypothetical protein
VGGFGFAIERPPTEHANPLRESTIDRTLASSSGSRGYIVFATGQVRTVSRVGYKEEGPRGSLQGLSVPGSLLLFFKLRFVVRSVS